jgi:hypothetical protein
MWFAFAAVDSFQQSSLLHFVGRDGIPLADW